MSTDILYEKLYNDLRDAFPTRYIKIVNIPGLDCMILNRGTICLCFNKQTIQMYHHGFKNVDTQTEVPYYRMNKYFIYNSLSVDGLIKLHDAIREHLFVQWIIE